MKKFLLFCIAINSVCVLAYPAYMASDCNSPLEKKAITYESLGAAGNKKFLYTMLIARQRFDYAGIPPHRMWGIDWFFDSTEHSRAIFSEEPEVTYDKTVAAIANVFYMLDDPNDYWSGIDSMHYWRKSDPFNPASFSNSTRILKNVTTCNVYKGWGAEP